MKRLAAALLVSTLLSVPAFADDAMLSPAAQALKAAAMKGDGQAAYNLAFCYHEGKDCPQSDADTVKWLRAAADRANIDALINLGDFYHQGIAVPQDDNMALTWYRAAAGHGSPEGEYNIGKFYANGIGTKADPAQATAWYLRAANQGLEEAQLDLAQLYMQQNDYPNAYIWFAIAAKAGSDKGAAYRDRVGKTLTEEQAKAAQAKVTAFHAVSETAGYDQRRAGNAKAK
jgi:TPR repeat protein